MLPHSSKLCNSDNLALQQQRHSELDSLFLFLIDSCISHSSAVEQRSLAQYIKPLYTNAVEINPNTYNFLTPQYANPSKLERTKVVARKDETPKSKKTKSLTNRRKLKKPLTPSTSKDSRPLVLTILPISTIKIQGSSLTLSNLNSRDDLIQRLLKAIELSADDLTTIVLSRLLLGYSTFCKVAVSQRRLRRMVRLDATNYCLRAMRVQLADTNPSPLKIVAVDALAKTLMSISAKDRKLMLKVRISGLLFLLANRVLEADRLFTTVTLLRLTSRCLRSPRNAQLIGKERRFAERFVALLNAFTAAMDYPSTSNLSPNIVSARDFSFSFDIPSVSALLQKTPENDSIVAAEKMARLVEILFFSAKNKHNKSQLLDNQALCVLKTIFENHFERRYLDTIHLEIALISLATIRQFSKTKKGKDQLKELSILEMCEKYINLLTEDKRKLANRPKTLSLYSQLQDSLCALCLRCLPQLPFPMAKQAFLLKFPLPAVSSSVITTANQTPMSKPKSTKSASSQKRRLTRKESNTTPIKNDMKENNTDDGHSSDDGNYDEEEDSLLFFNTSEGSPSSFLCPANDTDLNYSDEDDDCNAVNSNSPKLDPSFNVNNYSRQSLPKLKSNYQENFIEIEQDAIANGDSSPKLRKTFTPAASSSSAAQTSAGKLNKSHRQTLINMSKQTKSVGKFVKIAYPDLINLDECVAAKQLLLPASESMREMVMNELAKSQNNVFKRRIVYDLDALLTEEKSNPVSNPIDNCDLKTINQFDAKIPHLKFESRFESGNLRQAIQVSDYHYELVLSPDINQHSHHYQWFYFEVSNNQPNVTYTFEIINCLKNSSMFSRGMQPVLFSVTEASQGKPGWVRAASSVCYYRNLYTNTEEEESSEEIKHVKQSADSSSIQTPKKGGTRKESDSKSYFSTRFTLKFCHAADVCYLAYHYPYTYSYLNATLESILSRTLPGSNIYLRSDFLTSSLNGNPIRLLTITAPGSVRDLKQRDIILFSARVHPGESNSSWIMHGILKFLSSESPMAVKARELFVFKIVPILNPDGVINGSHRCSLAGIDLNRVWNNPSHKLHPTIFHTKGIIQYLADVTKKRPFAFVDLHGHSRRPNIFMYGNNPEESWRPCDHSTEHNYQFLALPEVLEKLSSGFTLSSCRFAITKAKEFSARIAMWRQFNLERAYTMEATYCGFDSGCFAGKQITIHDLMEMGANLCEAVVLVKNVADGVVSTETEVKK